MGILFLLGVVRSVMEDVTWLKRLYAFWPGMEH